MYKTQLSAADQCVMCGMCQPHCPTYLIEQNESESPRGRLSLILGLASQQLTLDDSIIKHLNNCVGCGACESTCPSRVPFLRLMDDIKTEINRGAISGPSPLPKPFIVRAILVLIKKPSRYRLLGFFIRRSSLVQIARYLRLIPARSVELAAIARQSKASTAAKPSIIPATGTIKGDVGLFSGCISSLFDQQSLDDSIKLLTLVGYNVHLLPTQVCCGALHQHNGEPEQALQLAEINRQLFNQNQLDAIVSTATGCTAQLQTHDLPVLDIMQFIRDNNLLAQLTLQPLSTRVALHSPCSQQNQLKLAATDDLLNLIPGLNIQPLASNKTCCGAGGVQLLMDNTTSSGLAQLKCDDLQSVGAEILVTSNYGCGLHIATALRSQQQSLLNNKSIEICHPISLLVRSASLQ